MLAIQTFKGETFFATFANTLGHYGTDRICKEAELYFKKENIFAYDETNLPDIKIHADFIKKNYRGYGYWIWKPIVVLESLKRIKMGDVLVYCDSGCTLNPHGLKRFNEYLDLAFNSKNGFVNFLQTDFTEKHWCKKSLIDLLKDKGSYDQIDSGQLWAGAFLIRKTDENVKLIEKWLEIASLYWTIDDSHSTEPNYPGFREHRHDQSIFSLLAKCETEKINLLERVWANDFSHPDMKNYPIWATRKKK